LSERRNAPFGCEAVVNPEHAAYLTSRIGLMGPLREPAGASSLATNAALATNMA